VKSDERTMELGSRVSRSGSQPNTQGKARQSRAAQELGGSLFLAGANQKIDQRQCADEKRENGLVICLLL
jgi:hypothetical protein